ncbi:MAG: hypothetical protein H6705_07540 [Myxococcales bacterium]|nr:hypothetical protein [Myxococcales bacterium]
MAARVVGARAQDALGGRRALMRGGAGCADGVLALDVERVAVVAGAGRSGPSIALGAGGRGGAAARRRGGRDAARAAGDGGAAAAGARLDGAMGTASGGAGGGLAAGRRALRARVVDALRAVLGLGADDPLDPDRPLRELGLDSLMALEVRKRLAAVVGRALPATLVFDHPTVTALLAALAPAAAVAPRRARVAAAGGEVAIVGMACRLPGGVRDPDALWRLLVEGREGIVEVPPDRWDVDAWYDPDPEAPGKMVTRRGGFIDGIDRFDAAFFGMAAAEARSVDPQQRMLLELTWEALERAGIPPSRLSGRRVGVFLGMAVTEYGQLELHAADPRGITPWSGQGAVLSMAAGRIAYVFGFEGPAMVVDTACSSSLVAAHLAARSLRRGECDLAVIAGTNLMLTPRMTVYFTKMRALSPDGRSKSFAADADGYGRAEGLGVVIAQRLEDARAEGQRVVACIRGTATNQDGRSVGVTAPRGPAQVQVIRDALDDAGITPDAVDYVEAHGTGTPLGDPIELGALAEAYGAGRRAPLRVGSLKSNIGHMEASAGIGGLIKLALMIERGHMPRTLHVRRPTPRIDWETAPLRLVTEPVEWPGPRRIGGVSSFGFSGSNAHIVLAAPEPVAAPVEAAGAGPWILPLSARDPAALDALAAAVAEQLAAGADLRAVVRTAAHRRDHLPHRLAVVAADAAEAVAGCGRRRSGGTRRRAAAPAVAATAGSRAGRWRGPRAGWRAR